MNLNEKTNTLCVVFVGAIAILSTLSLVVLAFFGNQNAQIITSMNTIAAGALTLLAAAWQAKGHTINLPGKPAQTVEGDQIVQGDQINADKPE